jgi:hypothetical protein
MHYVPAAGGVLRDGARQAGGLVGYRDRAPVAPQHEHDGDHGGQHDGGADRLDARCDVENLTPAVTLRKKPGRVVMALMISAAALIRISIRLPGTCPGHFGLD